VRVRRTGLPPDQRLDALETDLHDLAARKAQDHATLTGLVDGVREEVQAVPVRLESERKRRLERSLLWEEAGVWIFIAGLIVTTVGAIV